MYGATLVGIVAAILACAFAIWRSDGLERLAAVLILLDWLASPLLESHDAFRHAQRAIFAIDAALALALIVIAMRTSRFWPLWAAAFQLLELLMHLAMLVDHHVRPKAYFIGIEISSYMILAALVAGAWFETAGRPAPASSAI